MGVDKGTTFAARCGGMNWLQARAGDWLVAHLRLPNGGECAVVTSLRRAASGYFVPWRNDIAFGIHLESLFVPTNFRCKPRAIFVGSEGLGVNVECTTWAVFAAGHAVRAWGAFRALRNNNDKKFIDPIDTVNWPGDVYPAIPLDAQLELKHGTQRAPHHVFGVVAGRDAVPAVLEQPQCRFLVQGRLQGVESSGLLVTKDGLPLVTLETIDPSEESNGSTVEIAFRRPGHMNIP